MKYLILICILCFTVSCQKSADVAPPSSKLTLTPTELVVVLEIRVENDEWSVNAKEIKKGVPTAAIVKMRDILIEYAEQDGKVLGNFSIRDPRIIIEEEAPDFSNVIIQPVGSTLVTIPYLPSLEAVSLRGQTQKLQKLEKSFKVGAQLKVLYKEFEAASK